MNKNELVEAVAGQVGDRRTAAAAVEAVLGTVMRAVRDGEPVALSGFGVFEKVERAARSARNPSTGATVAVAATSAPRFRPGQVFKDVVGGRRELPALSAPVAGTAQAAVAPAESAPVAEPGAGTDQPARSEATGGKRGKRATGGTTAAEKAPGNKATGKKATGKKATGKKAPDEKPASKKPDSKKAKKGSGRKKG